MSSSSSSTIIAAVKENFLPGVKNEANLSRIASFILPGIIGAINGVDQSKIRDREAVRVIEKAFELYPNIFSRPKIILDICYQSFEKDNIALQTFLKTTLQLHPNFLLESRDQTQLYLTKAIMGDALGNLQVLEICRADLSVDFNVNKVELELKLDRPNPDITYQYQGLNAMHLAKICRATKIQKYLETQPIAKQKAYLKKNGIALEISFKSFEADIECANSHKSSMQTNFQEFKPEFAKGICKAMLGRFKNKIEEIGKIFSTKNHDCAEAIFHVLSAMFSDEKGVSEKKLDFARGKLKQLYKDLTKREPEAKNQVQTSIEVKERQEHEAFLLAQQLIQQGRAFHEADEIEPNIDPKIGQAPEAPIEPPEMQQISEELLATYLVFQDFFLVNTLNVHEPLIVSKVKHLSLIVDLLTTLLINYNSIIDYEDIANDILSVTGSYGSMLILIDLARNHSDSSKAYEYMSRAKALYEKIYDSLDIKRQLYCSRTLANNLQDDMPEAIKIFYKAAKNGCLYSISKLLYFAPQKLDDEFLESTTSLTPSVINLIKLHKKLFSQPDDSEIEDSSTQNVQFLQEYEPILSQNDTQAIKILAENISGNVVLSILFELESRKGPIDVLKYAKYYQILSKYSEDPVNIWLGFITKIEKLDEVSAEKILHIYSNIKHEQPELKDNIELKLLFSSVFLEHDFDRGINLWNETRRLVLESNSKKTRTQNIKYHVAEKVHTMYLSKALTYTDYDEYNQILKRIQDTFKYLSKEDQDRVKKYDGFINTLFVPESDELLDNDNKAETKAPPVSFVTREAKQPKLKISFSKTVQIFMENLWSKVNIHPIQAQVFFACESFLESKKFTKAITSHNGECTLWKYDNMIYSSLDEKLHAINSRFYPDYWAVIPEEVEGRLEDTILAQVKNILSKGIIGTGLGVIKRIKNDSSDIFEITTNSDLRLCATKVIQDKSSGKYLIIFDKITNHTGVHEAVSLGVQTEILQSEDAPDELPPQQENFIDALQNQYDNAIRNYAGERAVIIGDDAWVEGSNL